MIRGGKMVAKGSIGRLYLLLSACMPDTESIKKRQIIEEILESKEYRQLSIYEPAMQIVTDNYSRGSLLNLSLEQLEQIPECIILTQKLIPQIINCIKYGQAYDYSENDIPDFYSIDSLRELTEKSIITGIENITNIDEKNFIQIFNSNTTKDIDNLMDQLDFSDFDNLESQLYLSGKLYCISGTVIQQKRQQVNDLLAEIEQLKQKTKDGKSSIIKKKFRITIATFFFMSILITTGLMTQMGSQMFLGLSFLGLIAYWIMG